jgi:uncharacterized protein (TIGR00369 family)
VFRATLAQMTAEEIDAYMVELGFSSARGQAHIEAIDHAARSIRLRMPFRPDFVRPGGTVSGPALMYLADTAAFFLVLALRGRLALAVTANLNISFLERPAQADVIASARMLKLGRRLAVIAIELQSADAPDLIAHATATYALPGG